MDTIQKITTAITSSVRRNWLTALFVALYVLVTIATLRHSAAGFASLEGGSVAWGYLSALAVDAGMALSATGLRKPRNWRTDWQTGGALIAGLLVSAVASTFTQLLYAVAHADVMTVAGGAQWLGPRAQRIADLRVVVLPALLPTLSIVYSFASKAVQGTDHTAALSQALTRCAALEAERDEARRIAANAAAEAQQARGVSALLEALPQQTRGELYALAARSNGDGPDAREVAAVLGISVDSARRAVKAVQRERA